MTAEVSISKLLSSPLGSDWTVEWLAEQVLSAIALAPSKDAGEAEELVLDADTITERQSRRLLRPLLACLARKSAAERGTSPNLYQGRLAFERPGQGGSVWILGEFTNLPSAVRVRFRRSNSPPQSQGAVEKGPKAFAPADPRTNEFPPMSTCDSNRD